MTPVVVRHFSSVSTLGGAATKVQTGNAELTKQVETLALKLKDLQQRIAELEHTLNH